MFFFSVELLAGALLCDLKGSPCFFKGSKLSISFHQAAEQSLKVLRIFEGGVTDTFVSQYSGGMKRRLSVAISLIGDPKVRVQYNCP